MTRRCRAALLATDSADEPSGGEPVVVRHGTFSTSLRFRLVFAGTRHRCRSPVGSSYCKVKRALAEERVPIENPGRGRGQPTTGEHKEDLLRLN